MFRLNTKTTKVGATSKLESNRAVEVRKTATVTTQYIPVRRRRRKLMLANASGGMRSTWF